MRIRSIIEELLDAKMGQPQVALLLLVDGLAHVVVLGSFAYFTYDVVARVADDAAMELSRADDVLSAVCAIANGYLLVREGIQAYSTFKLGQEQKATGLTYFSWASDPDNIRECFTISAVAGVLMATFVPGMRTDVRYRYAASITCAMLWINGMPAHPRLSRKPPSSAYPFSVLSTAARSSAATHLLDLLLNADSQYSSVPSTSACASQCTSCASPRLSKISSSSLSCC